MTTDPSAPTERCFVLLPGAGGASWYWHRVAPALEAAGHDVLAIELPGADEDAGLAEYADRTVATIGNREGVVLVAQSMGAFVAPLVAARVPVDAVVLVNPMIPRPGERPTDWWGATGSEPARRAAAVARGDDPEFDLERDFLHDIDPQIATALMDHDGPESDAAFLARCAFTAWPDVPIRVAAAADDRFFPLEFQRQVARERLGVDVDALPGGHLNALSQPEAVAQYLLRP
ncbi:MAG: alpha/beta fold hydrolase [Patulibacter sp.]|nr:alpha/beta fold hydrolase [Patulibacter sp.]